MPIGYFPVDPPIVSGDDMTINAAKSKKQFGGKRAAPFKPGGGRKQSSPRTHKGTIRQKKGSK